MNFDGNERDRQDIENEQTKIRCSMATIEQRFGKKIGKNVVIPWWGLARSWHHPTMVAIQNSTVSTFRK